jgi:dTDP-4-dehydrorhamnose 3,5-epimerase
VIVTPCPGGVTAIDPHPQTDARGSFMRLFCAERFAAHGLPTAFAQVNLSTNGRRGTLRGLHHQAAPHAEGKLVQCVRGAIFDVAVDIRADSPRFGCWTGMVLSAANRRAVFIPPGFAHGFQTLEDDSDVLYAMTEPYHPELARGLAWNDPAFGIVWPLEQPILSPRDAALPRTGQLSLAQSVGIA